MKRVGTLCRRRETVVADKNQSVLKTAQVMADHDIGAVPVLDGDRLVGIFTERDIMSRVVAAEKDPATTTVGSVMSTTLVTADVTDTHEACLQRMQQQRVRHLLVLNSGRLAGIVSLRDLQATELSEKDEAINLLNAYVRYIPVDWTAKK
ncbi:MAG: CBS domain-containing protein [Acidimicrobiia bacterium]